MIDNVVTQFYGHLQIQDKEFFENNIIDYSLAYTDSIKQILDNNEHVDFYFPRIYTGVLASSGESSKVAIIMGVDYQKEIDLVDLKKKIARFYFDSLTVNNIASKMDDKNSKIFLKYKNKVYSEKNDLSKDLFTDGLDTVKYIQEIFDKTKLPEVNFNEFGEEVIVGYKLAQYLGLGLGDSIVLISQGFRGASAVGKHKIAGFLNFPTDAFNSMFIFMPIHTSQLFLSAYETNNDIDTTFYVNYIAINTTYQASIRNVDYEKILNVKTEIEDKFTDKMLTIVGWHNLDKDFVQSIQAENYIGGILILVLYLIISFGVLGTVMMMIAERKREFGVMMAIGMKRQKLAFIVAIEMFFMGMIAAIAGIIVTTPIIWYGHNFPIKIYGELGESLKTYNMEPVLPFQSFDTYILWQLGMVALIVTGVLLYAIFKIRKLKVITALKT